MTAFISLPRMRTLAQNPLKWIGCCLRIVKHHIMAALNFIFYQDFISLLLYLRFYMNIF